MLYDAFTGNNIIPNTLLWEIISGSPLLISDRLRLNGGSISDVVKSIGYFTGDFDVQVDFDVTGTPATNSWNFIFTAYIDDTHQIYCGPEYNNYKDYQVGYINGGGWGYTSFGSRSADTGSIRILRNGTNIAVYFYSGGWIHVFDTTIGNTGDKVYMKLGAGVWNSRPSFTAYFDNLIINSGTVEGLSLAPAPCRSLTTCEGISLAPESVKSLTTCEGILLPMPGLMRSITSMQALQKAIPLGCVSITTCQDIRLDEGRFFLIF